MKEKGGAPFFPVVGMGLASGKSLLLRRDSTLETAPIPFMFA